MWKSILALVLASTAADAAEWEDVVNTEVDLFNIAAQEALSEKYSEEAKSAAVMTACGRQDLADRIMPDARAMQAEIATAIKHTATLTAESYPSLANAINLAARLAADTKSLNLYSARAVQQFSAFATGYEDAFRDGFELKLIDKNKLCDAYTKIAQDVISRPK